jgi:hypothetical protein
LPRLTSGEIDFFAFCGHGAVPKLPPLIPPAISKRIRDDFDWKETEPVPNLGEPIAGSDNPFGDPTLYYALIYVEDKSDLQKLNELQIHHDKVPLFSVERDPWAGLTGALTAPFDGDGAFLFAVIPGLTYNLIREAALCSDPSLVQEVFRAIVLLDVPVAEARNADGSLSYEYLAREGFRYRGLPNCDDDQMPPATADNPEGLCDSPFPEPSSRRRRILPL